MAARITQKVVEVVVEPTTQNARVTQVVVEIIIDAAAFAASASDTLSLSDEVATSVVGSFTPLPMEISDSFALAEGTVKAQRKNAPNIPVIVFDQFSDSFEIIGEFGLQLDTMRDAEFAWDITDVFNLTDAIYSSEYIEISAESDFVISDEVAFEIALSIEVYDSFQDVWYSEEEVDLVEISLAVPMTLEVSDTLEFTDEIAFIRASGRDVEDRFTLADSVRVRFEHYLEITGDLLALSDALEVGWNPSVQLEDSLNLDDSGGVETLMPSRIDIEVGVSESRLVVTEGLALFDGDFSTQGTEIFLGGTRLSYLRRYLNDVPR